MYYFGYCTWLTEAEMRRFMPEANVVAKGYLQNSLIAFCTVGDRRERGWCHLDLTPNAWGEKTYGTIVEHDEKYYVDYPDFERIPVTVYGEDGKMYDCWTYILTTPGIAMKPPKGYWANVDNGLKECEFSEEYAKKVTEVYNKSVDCPE